MFIPLGARLECVRSPSSYFAEVSPTQWEHYNRPRSPAKSYSDGVVNENHSPDPEVQAKM